MHVMRSCEMHKLSGWGLVGTHAQHKKSGQASSKAAELAQDQTSWSSGMAWSMEQRYMYRDRPGSACSSRSFTAGVRQCGQS